MTAVATKQRHKNGDDSSDAIHEVVRSVVSCRRKAVDVDVLARVAALVVTLDRDDVR